MNTTTIVTLIIASSLALYICYDWWWLNRKSKAPLTRVAPEAVGDLPGPGTYKVDVVGESNYQDALSDICGGKSHEGADRRTKATLILEDSNPHDSKAIRVDIQGRTVGYLSKENARQYRDRLASAGHSSLVGRCDAVIRGGWDRGRGNTGHFGVKLDLPVT